MKYYIPFYQPRGVPTIERVAIFMLNEALNNKQIIVNKSLKEAKDIAKDLSDGEGTADCFVVEVTEPRGWGVYVKNIDSQYGIRCDDNLRDYLDIV